MLPYDLCVTALQMLNHLIMSWCEGMFDIMCFMFTFMVPSLLQLKHGIIFASKFCDFERKLSIVILQSKHIFDMFVMFCISFSHSRGSQVLQFEFLKCSAFSSLLPTKKFIVRVCGWSGVSCCCRDILCLWEGINEYYLIAIFSYNLGVIVSLYRKNSLFDSNFFIW